MLPIVFGMALMMGGGLAQVFAGLWEFRKITNTTFGRTVLPIHSLS